MFAGPNLEKFNDAVKHSMDIASRLNGDGIIAVLNGMMTRPSTAIHYGGGQGAVLMDPRCHG